MRRKGELKIMKNWTIREIEAVTEEQARKMSSDMMVIKEHNIYFVYFDGYFKYSYLVFKDNHHIYHANDYELHHSNKTQDELKAMYIEKVNNILFTEKEIDEPIKDYDEYTRKKYFLHNYYAMRTDYVSAFEIFETKEDKKAFDKKVKDLTYNPVGFCYMADKDFITHHITLCKKLQNAKAKMQDNYDYLKEAFLKEMYNHEYPINWQGNYDVLSCFGSITYNSEDNFNKYFDELNFTETQRKAYVSARSQCLQEFGY